MTALVLVVFPTAKPFLTTKKLLFDVAKVHFPQG
jgi:hypothetical protein